MFVSDSMKRSDIVGKRLGGVVNRMALALLCCLALGLQPVQASEQNQDFPSQGIRLILPFSPGSGMDSVARYLASKLSETLGQTAVVENRPGGNGFIAVRAVLSAPADGHTILIGSNSTLWTNAVLFKELPYDPLKDFTPITALFRGGVAYLVPAGSPYQTMPQLIEAARKEPGTLRFGSASLGYRLMVEDLNRQLGLQTSNIPFKSASEVVTAVAAGTLDFGVADISAALGLIQSGKVRALAVASTQPSALLPGVQTVEQAGAPGYSAYTWVSAVVNQSTPKPISDKLSAIFAEILSRDETKELYTRLGLEAPPSGPEFLKKLQLDEYEQLKRTVEFAKIELL